MSRFMSEQLLQISFNCFWIINLKKMAAVACMEDWKVAAEKDTGLTVPLLLKLINYKNRTSAKNPTSDMHIHTHARASLLSLSCRSNKSTFLQRETAEEGGGGYGNGGGSELHGNGNGSLQSICRRLPPPEPLRPPSAGAGRWSPLRPQVSRFRSREAGNSSFFSVTEKARGNDMYMYVSFCALQGRGGTSGITCARRSWLRCCCLFRSRSASWAGPPASAGCSSLGRSPSTRTTSCLWSWSSRPSSATARFGSATWPETSSVSTLLHMQLNSTSPNIFRDLLM